MDQITRCLGGTRQSSHFTQPQPAVTISLWPRGCVCQALRAPGSKVTSAAETRDGSVAANSGWMRTVPVNESSGPLPEGCEPLRLTSIRDVLSFGAARG